MSKPKSKEIEVSIFGPGIGESCLLHLGDGRWLVVDSCTGPNDRPVALSYLEDLGLDPTDAITDVVATHWHDDHIDGIAELYRVANSARFHCSAALEADEMFRLLQLQRGAQLDQPSGTDELTAVFQVIDDRKPAYHRSAATGPNLIDHCDLVVRESVAGRAIRLWGLSPSTADIHRARQAFAALIQPDEATRKKKIPKPDSNHSSVVLLLEAEDEAILLGADRETTTDRRTGWTSIIDSDQRPRTEAGIFKVPHHGSPDADAEDIWNELLDSNAIAAVTPYTPSGRPKDEDIMRLRERTDNLYCTAPPRGPEPKRVDRTVDKMMEMWTEDRSRLNSEMGQVRIRFDLTTDDPPTVETFGKAKKVSA